MFVGGEFLASCVQWVGASDPLRLAGPHTLLILVTTWVVIALTGCSIPDAIPRGGRVYPADTPPRAHSVGVSAMSALQLCGIATTFDGTQWDNLFPDHVSEAQRRGLTVAQCKELVAEDVRSASLRDASVATRRYPDPAAAVAAQERFSPQLLGRLRVSSPGRSSERTAESIYASSAPSVFSVRTPDGIASGFAITARVLVTNQHVVGHRRSVLIIDSQGRSGRAAVISVDPVADIAFLYSEGIIMQPLPLAAGEPTVGATAYAIGSPLGLQNTITKGLVSGLRRNHGILLVQTDAAINPGNSGGPLLNDRGDVIGIASFRLEGGSIGLNFAVSASEVRRRFDAIAE
jgi:S1-C subfamily serine protease